ncbi:MAG: orotate phosphoribosyltransferase [Patescibacteria group bacterium]|jgi:orotate phosphoribosyltransferase
MHEYQKQFINFLVESDALQFGEFTLKSGRVSPYFINTGKFDTGKTIGKLGYFYAAAINEQCGSEVDAIFGPAYKGIPLAVAAATALHANFEQNVGYVFDRKETKEHGDKGATVGYALQDGSRVVIVDDVFTTGATKEEAVMLLKGVARVEIKALVIAVDRKERGKNGENAIAEFASAFGIPVISIVTIHDIVEHLKDHVVDDSTAQKITAYLSEHGIT